MTKSGGRKAMTKEDIKKALEFCDRDDYFFCGGCAYDNVRNCHYKLKTDALNIIIEQEKEIERLKDDYSKLQEQFAQYQMASGKEITTQVRRAKIEVLNELKPLLEGYIHTNTGESLYVYTCKMFNIEVQNGEDKG